MDGRVGSGYSYRQIVTRVGNQKVRYIHTCKLSIFILELKAIAEYDSA
jgi:hypothetical protein